MKVAFYNHTSDVSGAEISLLLTARHLQHAEPVIYAPEGELLDRAKEAGIRTVSLPSYRARLSRNPLQLLRGMIGMAAAGFRFARAIRNDDVDIVHANSLRAGIMASLYAWLHRRPVVWHVRDNPPGGFVGSSIHFVSKRSAAAVIGISKAVLDGFDQSKLGDKLHLVHNGIEWRDMSPRQREEHRERIRRELDTPRDSVVITIIGQIAPWKRQEDAIRALRGLADRGHEAVLWIVGEPKFRKENEEYGEALRQLAVELGMEDRMRFTGFRKDVLEICAAADLLFLCSDKEPFGRVLIEAMMLSVPVVATEAGGVPEIVLHGNSGLLYPVGDVDALVSSTAGLVQYPSLRQGMGYLGQERVLQHFTIQSTVSKVEAIYDSLSEGRRGSESEYRLKQSVKREFS
jgi:L-malate glycosyltransferase